MTLLTSLARRLMVRIKVEMPDVPARAFRTRLANYWPLALAAALGVFAGVGTYTFRYAEGLSYFSRDPRACVNCHIMEPQYDAWQKSGHHHAAVCVDCHLPHSFFAKYWAKAENGWRHGKKFTTQDFVEPIVVQEAGMQILEDNCVRCHGPLVDSMDAHAAHREETQCVHCHASVGHGPRAGLGGPWRPDELDEASVAPSASHVQETER